MARIPKALKISLFAFGALAGGVLIAALVVPALVDIDDYRPRVEAAASGSLGMDVTVEGPLRLGLLPRLHIVLGNVRVRNRGSELAFIESADLSIELLPLLRRELRYSGIDLERTRLTIERGRDGYNFQKPPGEASAFRPLELSRVSFPSLVLVYVDKVAGTGFESANCSGELTDLTHPGGAPFLMRLSLAGQVACDDLHGKETTMSDVKFSLSATDGVFDFKPFTMRFAGGQGSRSLRVDRSAPIQVLHLDYTLSKFHVEQSFKALLRGERKVKGVMDLSTTLVMRGRSRVEFKQSAEGKISLSGKDLTLTGADLDQAIAKYGASQNFNLLDLSAFVLAGPFGLMATKGYELSTLAENAGGSTHIGTVVSRWKVTKGVAHAEDVAMATAENRLAFHGALDFVRDEYSDVVVAVVDSNGCEKVRQRVHGPISKPVVEKPGALKSLAGPVVNLIGKARDLLPGGTKCEAFYQGSVAPPK